MSELWIKLSVDYPSHPKVIKAGPEAAWLAVAAMTYARKHMTNGLIESAVVPTLAAVKRPLVLAAKLVEVGLWEVCGDAFLIHDFLKWNPSREAVEQKREKWKDTKRTQRSVHDGQNVDTALDTHETPRVRAGAGAPRAHSASVSASGSEVLEGGAGETIRPSGSMGHSGTLIDGRAQRRHGEHASPAACAIGACVHASQHDTFTRRLSVMGGKGPDGRTLREWYVAEADAIIANQTPVGEKVFEFWDNRFAAWIGVASSKPQNTKGTRTIAAGNRLQEKLDAGATLDPFGTNDYHEQQRQLADKAGV
jgi:hypothetical protein